MVLKLIILYIIHAFIENMMIFLPENQERILHKEMSDGD